jgi:hypothetical protein
LAFIDKSIRTTFTNKLENKPENKDFPPAATLGHPQGRNRNYLAAP